MRKISMKLLLSIVICIIGAGAAWADDSGSSFTKLRGLLGTLAATGSVVTCVALVWGTWYGRRVANREIAAYDQYLKNSANKLKR